MSVVQKINDDGARHGVPAHHDPSMSARHLRVIVQLTDSVT